MFQATINPESPWAAEWLRIFDSPSMPILSPISHRAQGPEGVRDFYRLDVSALQKDQRLRLVAHISAQWNLDPAMVQADMDNPEHGVPILATDVLVSIPLRMVL